MGHSFHPQPHPGPVTTPSEPYEPVVAFPLRLSQNKVACGMVHSLQELDLLAFQIVQGRLHGEGGVARCDVPC